MGNAGIIDQFVDKVELGLALLLSKLKRDLNDYAVFETTYGDALVAKDGSMVTVLRYNGYRTLPSKAEFAEATDSCANNLDPYLAALGHQLDFFFYRDENVADEIESCLTPMRDTAARIGMDIDDLVNEKRDVMGAHCMDEQVYICCWTRPARMDKAEQKAAIEEARNFQQEHQIPPMMDAQNVLRPVRFLTHKHNDFVAKVLSNLVQMGGDARIVEVGEAFTRAKRVLYRATPLTWRPWLADNGANQSHGDGKVLHSWGVPRAGRKPNDISAFMPPRLENQFFSAPAHNGERNSVHGVTDTKAVRIGELMFRPVFVKVPQQRQTSFTSLFRTLNDAYTEDPVTRRIRRMPWAISFRIEGDGVKAISLRKMIADNLRFASQINKNLSSAANALAAFKSQSGGGAVVKVQISAMTWAECTDQNLLMMRSTKLAGALEDWGRMTTEVETGDPTEAVLSMVPMVTYQGAAPFFAAPLREIFKILPLARPGSPFSGGSTLLRTMDGKLMPYEIFSKDQNTWLTLIFGGPGSGKSVFANRLNEEMCLMGGLQRLPFVCVIDIGISSSGFIQLIRDALPEDLKYQALYRRIQNHANFRVNPFDTLLGCRQPLPREFESMKNFLMLLTTSESRLASGVGPHRFMDAFISKLLARAFDRLSDRTERGQPLEAALSVNPELQAKVEELKLPVREATKWWQIVDMLSQAGEYRWAAVAQRYAVPTIPMLSQIAAELQTEFANYEDGGVSVYKEFILYLDTAIQSLPIFCGNTEYDVGESRIMALDLQDVVISGSVGADKQSALMYMYAINAFMRKISISKEDLDILEKDYRPYHARRFDEVGEEYKRLFIDEYHKTGGNPQLRENILIYGRESRKWALEIVLASQLPEDFAAMSKIATTVLILDSGTPQTRKTITETFGLSATETLALKDYVNGPTSAGATFLARIRSKGGEYSQLFTSSMGGLELWGLTTTAEDRALRTRLAEKLPMRTVRALLRDRFPRGGCKDWVMQMRSSMDRDDDEDLTSEELDMSIIERLAEEILADHARG